MKRITRIITILLALLLTPQLAHPVQAQGGNNWPNPNFMASAVLKEKTAMPYYDLNAVIDVYISNGQAYYVDEGSQAVVQILTPDENSPEMTAVYNEDQLRKMAETIAYDFIKDDTKLENLSFSLGQKLNHYFFHWDDTSKQLDDGTHPFIQVGLSQNGDFLNLTNTLPFGKEAGSFDVSQKMSSIAATTFYSGVYANGGAYWSQNGALSSATGGWFNLQPIGCSGSFCSQYYYSTARANPLYWGKWTPDYNVNTRATFFIPNNNATAWARYSVVDNYGTMVTTDINQYNYYNVFVPSNAVPMTAIRPGIWYIQLWDAGVNGTGSSSYKIAWDEVRIYTQSFDDVPESYWAYYDIERLFSNGITSGCVQTPTQNLYCPEWPVTRAQMAVFLLKGKYGSSYWPPSVYGTRFTDVPDSYWAADWIEQLAVEGITGGCTPTTYCPESNVTHAQMAVFLLRSKNYPSAYTPPDVGTWPPFHDVSITYWAAAWIKELAAEGISNGAHMPCTVGYYYPENPVTRAEMAGMLVRAFNLP